MRGIIDGDEYVRREKIMGGESGWERLRCKVVMLCGSQQDGSRRLYELAADSWRVAELLGWQLAANGRSCAWKY